VFLIVIQVQHRMDNCNIVNWIQKIVYHLTCHPQLNAHTVVLKYRTFTFTFAEKKYEVAVSAVCLLSLFNQSTLPADII